MFIVSRTKNRFFDSSHENRLRWPLQIVSQTTKTTETNKEEEHFPRPTGQYTWSCACGQTECTRHSNTQGARFEENSRGEKVQATGKEGRCKAGKSEGESVRISQIFHPFQYTFALRPQTTHEYFILTWSLWIKRQIYFKKTFCCFSLIRFIVSFRFVSLTHAGILKRKLKMVWNTMHVWPLGTDLRASMTLAR